MLKFWWQVPAFFMVALAVHKGALRAGAEHADAHVKARLISDTSAIEPGKPFEVGVVLTIVPGWHVYWSNAGDTGYPTTVEFQVPTGFSVSEVRYPVPQKFKAADNVEAFGYAGEVMLLATVTPPKKLDSSDTRIGADVGWLVCEKSCIAGNAKLDIELPAGNASADNVDLFRKWHEALPVPAAESTDVESVQSALTPIADPSGKLAGRYSIVVHWKADPPRAIEWFPPASEALTFMGIDVETSGHVTTVTTNFEQLEGAKLEDKLADSVIAYEREPGKRSGIAVALDLSNRRSAEQSSTSVKK